MSWLFIEAHDVWMFRDSKPFSAGQNFSATSRFPPHPQVMQGVIRSHLLETNGINYQEYGSGALNDTPLVQQIGQPGTSNLGELQLWGPLVARRFADGTITPLLRLPLDVLTKKSDDPDEAEQYAVLQPSRAVNMMTDEPFEGWAPLVLSEQAEGYKYHSAWLSQPQFENYLAESPITGTISTEYVYQSQKHTGLALNRRGKSAEESMLYHASFARPYETPFITNETVTTGLLLYVNLELGQNTLARMGGEGRFSYFAEAPFSLPDWSSLSGRIKVVLLTPAFFHEGWQPTNGDWSPWVGADAHLVSIATGQPMLISGWDVVANAPKPLYRYLPAGTVFYFDNASPIQQPFTENPPNTAASAMGFGAVAVGQWDYLS